jgi:CBS domain-containing protein
MADEGIGPLPVVDGERLVGIVTDRDLVVRVLADGRDVDLTTVGDVASPDVVTVESSDELERVLGLMAENKIRRVPVVDDGQLVGIVAQADVAREVDARQTGQVVEEISR